jgi:hypothetical protein
MIGCFLLGAAGLMMAARLAHRFHGGCHGGGGYGRWARHHGYGGYGGPGGFGGYGGGAGAPDHDPWEGGGYPERSGFGGRWGGGFGRRFFLRALIEQLDATPAQEKVIRDAADEFHETTSKLRGEARKTRDDVAGAFRKSHFDEVLFGELFARHDTAIESVRKAFVGLGARIHDVLDERQRTRLAEMIEAGPRGFLRGSRRRGGGPAWS